MIDIFLDRLKAAWFCLLGRGVICNIRFFRPVGIEKTKKTKMLIINSHFTSDGIFTYLEFLDVDIPTENGGSIRVTKRGEE